MVEENGELIYCEKRSARMHSRNCDILRKSIPICSDTGYVDKTLKLVNVCNDCPVVFQKLSVRRFIEYRKEFGKKYG